MPVDVTLGAYTNPEEAISSLMLGAEHLGGESLAHVMNNLQVAGVDHLRWPGGIPAEERLGPQGEYVFDLSNPDVMVWDRNGGSASTITEVLEKVVEFSMTFAIVAPTARYVEEMHESGGTMPPISAYDDVYQFLERYFLVDPGTGLTAFGLAPDEIPDLTIEIGSEYYTTEYWSAAITNGTPVNKLAYDFGLVFAEIARAIGDFESQYNIDVTTAVQMGRFQSSGAGDHPVALASAADNAAFISAFEEVGSLDVVDAVIWHRYADTFEQTAHGVESEIWGTSLQSMSAAWETATGNPSLDLVVGWLTPDVRSAGELAQHGDLEIWGARSLSSIMQGFSVLAGAGMDVGTIYSFGSNSNYGSLSQGEDIFIGGQLYDIMLDTLPGTYLHDGYQENTPTMVQDDGTLYNEYHFSNEYKIVSYFFSGDLQFDQSGEVPTLVEYSEQVVSVTGRRLYDPDGINEISSLNGTPIGVVGEVESIAPFLASDGQGIWFNFNHDYEVIVLEMYRAHVRISNDFSMSEHSDEIISLVLTGSGDYSGIGNDIDNQIYGNTGNNVLNGRSGDDFLDGGEGQDTIFGGGGQDTLEGSGGDDFLSGGPDSDWVNGGDGDDTIEYSGGNDTILGGQGYDVLDLRQTNEEVRLYLSDAKGEHGSDLFAIGGFEEYVFGDGNDHFQISGDSVTADMGGGNDNVVLNNSGNTLMLGEGDDFVFAPIGDNHDVHLGDGDDKFIYYGYTRTRIEGGGGDDMIFLAEGGSGREIVFGEGHGNDTIINMNPGEDTLILDNHLTALVEAGDYAISETEQGTLLSFGDGSETLFFYGSQAGMVTTIVDMVELI